MDISYLSPIHGSTNLLTLCSIAHELKITSGNGLQEDFFCELYQMLSEMPEVTEMHPMPDAHVPVMKFKFSGVSIDLLYASLPLLVVPELSTGLTQH
ncbi:hypothetical protein Pint_16564 [Pistacia integerrima]|uniref:Uncharacterized protein n=1 Tax=Pistacia integerrima TaxID=434235 RepID=A0ACC0ZD29_9ROSI|nr:hypothetical protein Pint_16564 [Pistacia integerrima]